MIGWALRDSFKKYRFTTFKHDLVAGLIVSLVALPLAMALAIAVGLPPQHGIYTAVVAGISVPLLGGSYHQVSGPTAAFVVIVAPIINQYGLRGLIITTIIAGFILIAAGALKLGRYIHYVPYPVVTGFTSGIALTIAVLSLNDFLGLSIAKMPDSFLDKVVLIAKHFNFAHWSEILVGFVSILFMLISQRVIKKIPSPIVGITAGALLGLLLNSYGVEIVTIGSRFSQMLPNSLSFGFLTLPSFNEIRILSIPAVIIAALAALESLLSATVADRMAGTKHNPNAELIGIGVGNILSGLASGIPATGALARTATNIQSGGKTPLASSIHALFIALYVLFFSHYISYIPMASLAALLLIVAYRMSHLQQFIHIIKAGPIKDALVLVTCFVFTVAIDMVAGVAIGIVLAYTLKWFRKD